MDILVVAEASSIRVPLHHQSMRVYTIEPNLAEERRQILNELYLDFAIRIRDFISFAETRNLAHRLYIYIFPQESVTGL